MFNYEFIGLKHSTQYMQSSNLFLIQLSLSLIKSSLATVATLSDFNLRYVSYSEDPFIFFSDQASLLYWKPHSSDMGNIFIDVYFGDNGVGVEEDFVTCTYIGEGVIIVAIRKESTSLQSIPIVALLRRCDRIGCVVTNGNESSSLRSIPIGYERSKPVGLISSIR